LIDNKCSNSTKVCPATIVRIKHHVPEVLSVLEREAPSSGESSTNTLGMP